VAHNRTTFRRGFRLWHSDEIQTLDTNGESARLNSPEPVEWRAFVRWRDDLP
jgi:hypothetical protein